MNRLNLNNYIPKQPNDQITADTWNGVFGAIQTAINDIQTGASTVAIDTSGVVSVNNKGNTTISSSKHVNIEPVYDSTGSENGTYGDVQIKPGDDITLESHHRILDKRDEITVKTSNGQDGDNKAPVKLQVIASDMTLSTKDKKGNDSNVMNINVTTGEDKGYLKVRAQAIDLRSETHGGIALQPNGTDGSNHMNKIKFEHGGGDGLEFGTFNAEKTSIFTDEYRFNKDGVWKMATRTKLDNTKGLSGTQGVTIGNGKYDPQKSNETQRYSYKKQNDDFYDEINQNDPVTTTNDIIRTSNAFNNADGMNTYASDGTLTISKDIDGYEVVSLPSPLALDMLVSNIPQTTGISIYPFTQGIFTNIYTPGTILTKGQISAAILGQLDPDEQDADVQAEVSEFLYGLSDDGTINVILFFEKGSNYQNQPIGESLCLRHATSRISLGNNINIKSAKVYINDVDTDDVKDIVQKKGNLLTMADQGNSVLKLAENSQQNTQNTTNFNFNTDAKYEAIQYVEGTTNPEVWANSATPQYTLIDAITKNNLGSVEDLMGANPIQLSDWGKIGSEYHAIGTTIHALVANADTIFNYQSNGDWVPYGDHTVIGFSLNMTVRPQNDEYVAIPAIAYYDTTDNVYKMDPFYGSELSMQEGAGTSWIKNIDILNHYKNDTNCIKPWESNYDDQFPNLFVILKVTNSSFESTNSNHNKAWIVDGFTEGTTSLNVYIQKNERTWTSMLTYNNAASIGTRYTVDQILNMFTWTGSTPNPLNKEVFNNVTNGHIIGIRYSVNNQAMSVIAFKKHADDITIVSGGKLNLIGDTNFGSKFEFGPTYNGIEAQWVKDENGVEYTGDTLRVVAINNSDTEFKYDQWLAPIKPGEKKVIAECSILDLIRLVRYVKRYLPSYFNNIPDEEYKPSTIRDNGIPSSYDQEMWDSADYYPSRSKQYTLD